MGCLRYVLHSMSQSPPKNRAPATHNGLINPPFIGFCPFPTTSQCFRGIPSLQNLLHTNPCLRISFVGEPRLRTKSSAPQKGSVDAGPQTTDITLSRNAEDILDSEKPEGLLSRYGVFQGRKPVSTGGSESAARLPGFPL